jgi:hypothetical protein
MRAADGARVLRRNLQGGSVALSVPRGAAESAAYTSRVCGPATNRRLGSNATSHSAFPRPDARRI